MNVGYFIPAFLTGQHLEVLLGIKDERYGQILKSFLKPFNPNPTITHVFFFKRINYKILQTLKLPVKFGFGYGVLALPQASPSEAEESLLRSDSRVSPGRKPKLSMMDERTGIPVPRQHCFMTIYHTHTDNK